MLFLSELTTDLKLICLKSFSGTAFLRLLSSVWCLIIHAMIGAFNTDRSPVFHAPCLTGSPPAPQQQAEARDLMRRGAGFKMAYPNAFSA